MMVLQAAEIVGGCIVVINVAQLLKSDVGTSRSYRVDESLQLFADSIPVVSPILGTGQLTRTNHGVLGQGQFSTLVQLECSRCLESFVENLRIAFAEEFIPVVDIQSGAPSKIPRDDGTFLINERHELDLEPAIREYGLLELPMKPLCQPECAGLCPRCGANRNITTCACVLDEPDERFAVLRALIGDDNR